MFGLLLGLLPAMGIVLVSGWVGLGFASTVWLLPLAHAILPHLSRTQDRPRYESVFESLNEGRVAAAEWEILRQLEKFPEDFQGWLLLAEVYAEHYRDVDSAQETVLATCAQKNVTWAETAVALHRLADWHLEITQDVAAAQRVLREIGRRMPGTHLAQGAQERLDRLLQPTTKNRCPPAARMAVEDPLNDKRTMSGPRLNQAVARARVTACVRCLERDPRDAAAREELARLYAEHLGEGDCGIRELKLLLELPDQPAHKIMEWLGLLSQWQEHYRNDAAASRQALRRIAGQFPQSVQAFAALRKLTLTASLSIVQSSKEPS